MVLHSLASLTTSDILTKGEWDKGPLEGLIRTASRERTNTTHHTRLADGSGHLLLLTTCTWTNAPATMPVMFGQGWLQTAATAAADRGSEGDTLRQAKTQAARQVLLEEARKTPIYIEGTSVVDETIRMTGPPSTAPPGTDRTSLSHSDRTQHPYNVSNTGVTSTTTLEALTNLCRASLLSATPHLQGLLFAPYMPSQDGEESSHGESRDSDNMSDDVRKPTVTTTPNGKDGAATQTSL